LLRHYYISETPVTQLEIAPLPSIPDLRADGTMVGKEARYYRNKELDEMQYWQRLPTLTFDIEDHILLDYVFRKMSENPVIAKQAGSLRNKLLVPDLI